MDSNNRIVFNTGILYAKMAVTTIISLFSVRLVLASLGEVDYGVYNVIMGIVSMLSFLNVALTISTQRYLSFYKGTGNKEIQIKIFNHSLILHLFLGIVVIIFLEVIGNYLLINHLTIPDDRITTAQIVFQIANLAVLFTFVAVPYSAAINSNEQLIFIAIVTILESFEKLALAIFLSHTKYDRLLIYGLGMGAISVISFLLYKIICNKKYDECNHFTIKNIDKNMLKDLGGFAGWNLVGSITAMSKNQGLSVLFNIFKGPAVNAAYGIAFQVSAQLNFFSMTLMRSINPQIMKSEGSGNRQKMIQLSLQACKYSFLLMALFSIPCIFEINRILEIWLKKVPDYTSAFCCFILLAMLFDQITVGINSAFQATKHVKESAICVGITKLLILPVGYLLLKLGFNVYFVVAFYAFSEFLAGIVRVILGKQLRLLEIKYFIQKVIIKIIPPTFIAICSCILLNYTIHINDRFLISFPIVFFIFSICSYLFSLEKNEQMYVLQFIKKIIKK